MYVCELSSILNRVALITAEHLWSQRDYFEQLTIYNLFGPYQLSLVLWVDVDMSGLIFLLSHEVLHQRC